MKEQNWYTINNLDVFCKMNSDNLSELKKQYESLLAVEDKPHILDDETIERVIKCYTGQKEFLEPERRQFKKWEKEEKLNAIQKEKISNAYKILDKKEKLINDILSLSEKLEKGTIDKIMAKDDMELGLEFLMKYFNK